LQITCSKLAKNQSPIVTKIAKRLEMFQMKSQITLKICLMDVFWDKQKITFEIPNAHTASGKSVKIP